jgi:hypothetical protein
MGRRHTWLICSTTGKAQPKAKVTTHAPYVRLAVVTCGCLGGVLTHLSSSVDSSSKILQTAGLNFNVWAAGYELRTSALKRRSA